MKTFLRRHGRKLLVVPPLALGVLIVAVAVQTREGPQRVEVRERVTPVRVVPAPAVDVVPRALAYGNVQPGKVWEAVAQVKGTVIARHRHLEKGAILAAGTELLRIDPTDYRLAVAQIEANIRAVEAQLAELDVRARNTERSLAIENRNLDLSQKDLERKRQLVRNRTVSQAAVDDEERAVLAGEQAMQTLRNTLNLIPAERAVLDAQKSQLEAQLAAARRDLDRTIIVAPFDCRIAAVNVEEAQFAAQGQVLVEADSLDVAEVNAQVPISNMFNLLPPGMAIPINAGTIMPRLREIVDLKAVVRLRTGDVDAEWEARFERVSDTVGPRTRTVGVIVAVDRPYQKAEAGRRPPLVKNMYVEVELRGRPRANAVIIPRAALHGGRVRIAGPDNRLVVRDVEVGFAQTNFLVVREGLEAGERVIVSDLASAVEGMLLEPAADEAAAAELIAEALGNTPVR